MSTTSHRVPLISEIAHVLGTPVQEVNPAGVIDTFFVGTVLKVTGPTIEVIVSLSTSGKVQALYGNGFPIFWSSRTLRSMKTDLSYILDVMEVCESILADKSPDELRTLGYKRTN